jgi:hypothetical protein
MLILMDQRLSGSILDEETRFQLFPYSSLIFQQIFGVHDALKS